MNKTHDQFQIKQPFKIYYFKLTELSNLFSDIGNILKKINKIICFKRF